MELPNTIPQAYWGKPIITCLAPVLGKETKPGNLLIVLLISFMIFPLTCRSADAKSARLCKRFRETGTNGRLNLSLTRRASKYPLKRPYKIVQSPETHGKPRGESLPVGKAQLGGCLKIWVSGPLE